MWGIFKRLRGATKQSGQSIGFQAGENVRKDRYPTRPFMLAICWLLTPLGQLKTHFYGKDVGAVLQKSRQTCYGRCYKERTPEGVDVCIIKVRTA